MNNTLLIDTPLIIKNTILEANDLMKVAEYYKRASWQQYVYENANDHNVTVNAALKIADEAIRISEDSGHCQDDCIDIAKVNLGYIRYIENDFYSIYMDGNVKMFRLNGYVYNTWNGSDRPCRKVTYKGAELPLEKFIAMNNEEKADYFDEIEVKTESCSNIAAKQFIENFYEYTCELGTTHWPGMALDASTLTMDTPCGDYVDYAEPAA